MTEPEKPEAPSPLVLKNLRAFKICYFAFFGGLASLLPHLSLFLRQAGITPSEMAVMGCITPLLGLFTRPLFGLLADKQKIHKQLAIICLLANGLIFSVMLVLPTRERPAPPSPIYPTYKLSPVDPSGSCFPGTLISALDPLVTNFSCPVPLTMSNCVVSCNSTGLTFPINSTVESCVQDAFDRDFFAADQCSFACSAYSFAWTNATKRDFGPDFSKSPCWETFTTTPAPPTGRTYRIDITFSSMFFIWLLVRSAAYAFFHPCFNLQDAMVFSVIGENRALFGQCRSYGSIGFFIFALVTSAIVHSTRIDDRLVFWPALLIYDLLMILAAGSVSMYRIKDAHANRNILKAVSGALQNLELSVMLFFLIITGLLNTMFEIYIFWYLADLKGTPLLFGVMLAVNCLFETPCIILAGRLIARIGEIPCMYLVFAAYAIRFIVYAFITNPWMCLIVEPLQGITMGIHLVAYTSYVARKTDQKALGSMTGLASGMHYGLGAFIGALAGGFTYDAFGPRTLYFWCSIISVGALVLYVFVQTCFVKRCSTTDVSGQANRKADAHEIERHHENGSGSEKPIVLKDHSHGNGRHAEPAHDEEELKTLTTENGHADADAESKHSHSDSASEHEHAVDEA